MFRVVTEGRHHRESSKLAFDCCEAWLTLGSWVQLEQREMVSQMTMVENKELSLDRGMKQLNKADIALKILSLAPG
jgi:hypothetical protein